MSQNDIPRGFKILQVFWPIALALTVGGATMVRADARIASVEVRVEEMARDGTPATRERLARIEEKLDAMLKNQLRMEAKQDDLDRRSREIASGL